LCLSAGNRRNRIGEEMALFSQSQLCLGAPDSVRCARLAQANLLLSGKINGVRLKFTGLYGMHRTVSGEPTVAGPTVGRLIRARRVAEPTARRGHRTVRCAPDSVRCANGQLRQRRKEIHTGQCPVVHRTVRCTRRQKARIAFLDCTQRLLAALGL
jgi:hypothetical protein